MLTGDVICGCVAGRTVDGCVDGAVAIAVVAGCAVAFVSFGVLLQAVRKTIELIMNNNTFFIRYRPFRFEKSSNPSSPALFAVHEFDLIALFGDLSKE